MTLVRGQLVECLLISLAGGLVGVLLSMAATKWLVAAWTDFPVHRVSMLDGTVLLFNCALVFATAILSGLLPAMSSTGRGAIAALHASSRTTAGSQSSTAMRKTLLTIEIAATVVLFIAAGLLLKSFWRMRTTNVGCATENVLTIGYSLPTTKYDSPEKVNALNETLLERSGPCPVDGLSRWGRCCRVQDLAAITHSLFPNIHRFPPDNTTLRAASEESIPGTSAHCRYRC